MDEQHPERPESTPPDRAPDHSGDPGNDDATSRGVALTRGLLVEEIPSDDRPDRRWAYPTWGVLVVSLFVAYHAAILLAYNLPTRSMNLQFQRVFNSGLQGTQYIRAAGIRQNWGMFAPNPHRQNSFLKVVVEDFDGRKHDIGNDIYGTRTYPYLFYERRRKVNRRLIEDRPGRKAFGASVCRDWERENPDRPPRSVSFYRRWTTIPPPESVYPTMSYDPMGLPVGESLLSTFECGELPHGRIPDRLRKRYGMEPAPPGWVREIEFMNWTAPPPEEQPARERREREPTERPSREDRRRERPRTGR